VLGLVGDVMLGKKLDERRKSSSALAKTVAALHRYELVVANLEMPTSRRGQPMSKRTTLRSDPDVLADVKALGICAVTLANNHVMDHGPDAMLDTVQQCEAAGITCCGAGPNLDKALEPIRHDINGQPVAIVGVACTLPVGAEATSSGPGIAPIRVNVAFEMEARDMLEQPGMMPWVRTWTHPDDQEAVCRCIADLKARAAVVVVMIHWGVQTNHLSPYQGLLAQYQRPLGGALVDAGADVVCGHHSHSVHPIELYHGKPIFYSLGNFLFEHPRRFMDPESIVATINPADPTEIRLVPVLLDGEGFPSPACDQEATRILNQVARLSKPLGTRIEIEGGEARVTVEP
jgi:poly-gamma-glutamate capsule biosynthesis protein CapA/YwtB (metallophosphatase superfamily)